MKKSRGLTLIELLIAFTILVLLAMLGFIAWQNQPAKARDARRKADIQRLTTAFEDYYGDAVAYPPANILTACGGDKLKTYSDSPIPCDPLTNTPYCYIFDSDDPVGQEFRVLASLENSSDPDIDRLGCGGPGQCGWKTECGPGFNYGASSTNTTALNPNTPFNGGASPSPASSPVLLPSGYPLPWDPGTNRTFACVSFLQCNSYGHPVANCHFFTTSNCDNMCSDSNYWCSE